MRMGRDVSEGMAYLAAVKIVHRFISITRHISWLLISNYSDLAARNCLVDEVSLQIRPSLLSVLIFNLIGIRRKDRGFWIDSRCI